nr:hypothetical protein [Burkholderia thailandensis]
MIRAWSQRHAQGDADKQPRRDLDRRAGAVAFGPPLGGLLVQYAGWRGGSGSTCRSSSSRSRSARRGCRPTPARGAPPREPREQDWLGAALFVATLASLLSFLQTAFGAPDWVLLGACVACGALLVGHERRVAQPLVDVGCWPAIARLSRRICAASARTWCSTRSSIRCRCGFRT